MSAVGKLLVLRSYAPRMLVVFIAAAMFSFVACIFQVRADSAADLQEALAAGERHDYTTEVTLLRPLAEQGNAKAQYELGQMYFYGVGVTIDQVEGARWYRKSGEQGNADAQYILGFIYYGGFGVPKDAVDAVKWYRKAADQGHILAQRALMEIYERGQGVHKDAKEAVKWRRKAAEHGNAEEQIHLGDMYRNGDGEPKDDAAAARWYQKAAGQGNAYAQYNLGLKYQYGWGLPVDYTEALRWYRKAAEQGYVKAQYELANMYSLGKGATQNNWEALRWYRKAADQGHDLAAYFLGVMYRDGEAAPKDYVQAYMWFNIAATGFFASGLAGEARDRLGHAMTPQQIAEAQQRTAAWRPVQPGEQQAAPGKSDDPWAAFNWRPIPEPAAPARDSPSGQLGTAFFIGDGALLTNAHVVKGCSGVNFVLAGQRMVAQVTARDEENDLALLRTATHSPAVAALRLSIRQGEAISAYGYPLPGLLASGGNLTTGNVTALSGIGDDSRFLQISAPVQPGNSGGPLLDGTGNVVGIVKGKLDATKVASAIGDVPQNVNFAIKASVVATFLDSNSIHYVSGVSTTGRSPADIAENARRFTVPVECSVSTQ
jgi:uncharacterized protein